MSSPNATIRPKQLPATAALSDSRDALVHVARRLGGGHDIDVQGTVVHTSRPATAFVHAIGALAACGVWLVWPLAGLALLFAVAWSAVAEYEGARGWMRGLAPRDVGHNLIIWDETPDQSCPRLVVAAPFDGSPHPRWMSASWILSVLIPVGLAAVGMAAGYRAPDFAQMAVSTAASLLALTTMGLGIAHILRSNTSDLGIVPTAEELLHAIQRQPTSRLRVVFLFTQGGSVSADGVETFLLNWRHRVDPRNTSVLLLQTGRGSLSLVSHEGRNRRRAAPPAILTAAHTANIPFTQATTAASHIHRLGWDVATLVGSPAEFADNGDVLRALVDALDRPEPS